MSILISLFCQIKNAPYLSIKYKSHHHDQSRTSQNDPQFRHTPFLSDNAPIYAADNAFKAITQKFTTDYAALFLSSAAASQSNSGFSLQKVAAKNAAAIAAATYSASAQVILETLGLFSLSNALHTAPTWYTHVSDAETASRLNAAYNILNTNLATITPDYLTAENLANLQNLINTFMQAGGTSREVHALSPQLTARFRSALKKVDTDVKNLKKLGKKYQLSNSDFYNELNKVCKIPPVNVRHTPLSCTITDSITGAPIAAATAAFSNSKSTATTSASGVLHLPSIGAGYPTITITAIGYPIHTSRIRILQGKDNSFTISLTKE